MSWKNQAFEFLQFRREFDGIVELDHWVKVIDLTGGDKKTAESF